MSPNTRLFWRLLLGTLLALATVRLAGFLHLFGTQSLQLDFSAYHAAGQALSVGLDPYRNHIDHDPPVWDGASLFTHSRFLYPPLVATLFLPLAVLPYALAKWLFMLLSGAALAAALGLLARDLGFGERTGDGVALGLVALFVLTAHPVLFLLERGQVDSLTLLLLVLAFRPAWRGSPPGLWSGVWLALATLLKLNIVYVAAFWVLRRWWKGLAGYGLGALGLVLLSLLVSGPQLFVQYALDELPRISAWGEGGTNEVLLPPEVAAERRQGLPEAWTRRDGRAYRIEPFGFAANASLARVIAKQTRRAAFPPGPAVISVVLIALAIAVLAKQGGAAPHPPETPPPASLLPLAFGPSVVREFAFFQAALAAVLLAGPLTWAMNTVWLVPAAFLLAAGFPPASRLAAFASAGIGLGLLLAWLPDQHAYPLLLPYRPVLGDFKYVAAEMAIFVAAATQFRALTREGANGRSRR